MPTVDIQDACLTIRNFWEEIKNDYFARFPGKYLSLTCVHRTPAEQLELFKKGRTATFAGTWVVEDQSKIVTNVDGFKVLGAHNYYPSRAIDVAVVDNQTGKALWEEKYYLPLLEIAKRYDLVSGGDWDGDGDRTDQKLHDLPHIEVKNYRQYLEVI